MNDNELKRARVIARLSESDTAELSDRAIARELGVSQPFVSALRRSLSALVSGDSSDALERERGDDPASETSEAGPALQDSAGEFPGVAGTPMVDFDLEDEEPPAAIEPFVRPAVPIRHPAPHITQPGDGRDEDDACGVDDFAPPAAIAAAPMVDLDLGEEEPAAAMKPIMHPAAHLASARIAAHTNAGGVRNAVIDPITQPAEPAQAAIDLEPDARAALADLDDERRILQGDVRLRHGPALAGGVLSRVVDLPAYRFGLVGHVLIGGFASVDSSDHTHGLLMAW